jgi:lipid-binding SYLF domain-containing protein
LQVGGELTDLLIVLRTKAAVVAFCSTLQASL